MTIAKKLNRAANALLRLAAPFWGKPRYSTIVHTIVEEVQALDDALVDFLEACNVETSTNSWVMGRLGKMVGATNLGYGLEDHRRILLAQVDANNSKAVGDDILAVATSLLPNSTPEYYNEGHDTVGILNAGSSYLTYPAESRILRAAVPGATTVVVYELAASTPGFEPGDGFAESTDAATEVGEGYSATTSIGSPHQVIRI
jgi:hypothetical protein